MSFTVDDYHDLIRLVHQHPEWKSELRQLLLSDELLALPDMVRELAASHQRAEERMARAEKRLDKVEERLSRLEMTVQALVEQVAQLIEVQKTMADDIRGLKDDVSGLKDDVSGLKDDVSGLKDDVSGLKDDVSGLKDDVSGLKDDVSGLKDDVSGLKDDVGALKGRMLEQTYHEKAGAYFGPLLSRIRLVELHTLEDTLEKYLTQVEFRDVLKLDLVVSGEPRHHPESIEAFLAVEVSSVVDQHDVDRAERRALLLRKAGYRAMPVVAGESSTRGAEIACRDGQILLLQDGRIEFWREALSVWIN